MTTINVTSFEFCYVGEISVFNWLHEARSGLGVFTDCTVDIYFSYIPPQITVVRLRMSTSW